MEPEDLSLEAAAESDAGPSVRGAEPERLCIATRIVRPVGDMIRFVVGPDDGIVPDLKRKLSGRGVWVTATHAALSVAIAKQAFARGFKRPVKAGSDLGEMTDRLLEQATLDALSMAHKAGRVLAGFSRVEAALDREDLIALIQAVEGAADGVRKLAAGLRQKRAAQAADVFILTGLNSMQLDLALGRSNVIHAALLAGSGSESVLARYRSLIGFRGSEQVSPAAADPN